MAKISHLKKKKKRDIFDIYLQYGFDLVPIQKNGKIPIEKEWTVKSHKDKYEWLKWIETGINIGVKTGKCSNLTILDIDTDIIPDELKPFLDSYKGLLQKSSKGFHYCFQYESDLPKSRIDKFKLDIENDGGQVVFSPSIIDGIKRQIIMDNPIPKMDKDLKSFLKKSLNGSLINLEKKEEAKLDLNLDLVNEGNRNNFLIKYGGILRQKLNIDQTEYVMSLANKYFIKPPLSYREVKSCVKSLDRYVKFDEVELAKKIADYMSIVPDKEATTRDIQEALRYPKKDIEKALSYLIREQYVVKKRRTFYLIQKVDWKEEFMDEGKEINFKFPYFHDIAHFRNGDMAVIGAKSGVGKTHIAINIIKQLKEQGIKPNYVSLESGNRFATIAKQLKLVEGDFRWDIHYNPENVELEKDAFTIIDWLLPKDYANTDKLFEYFSQQLRKNGGILLIFVQIRSDGNFYAKDMIEFFPSFVAKFFFEDEKDRTRSYFEPIKIREAKIRKWKVNIPTRYDWDTKELVLVENEEVNDENISSGVHSRNKD